jgi:glycosyltransferase involved in cell wall biosynthesis
VKGQGEGIKFLMKYGRSFDIIHAQTAKGQSIAVLTRVFHNRPIVYTRRVDFIPKGSLARLKYKLTNKVVAISTPIKEILEEFGVNNIEVIPSSVVELKLNRNRGADLIKDLSISGKINIAAISALVPHKDPLTMVETIKELSEIRTDFVFLHFGDGKLKKEVTKKITEYKLENIYRLPGFYDNVEDFFSIFDLFVMSSQEEGLGSSVLDAFIYKVPVVSTDAGGLKETVEGRGLLCHVKDSKCLANSINRILEDKLLRERLVNKAYNDVKEHYSLEQNINKYVRIFNSFIQ